MKILLSASTLLAGSIALIVVPGVSECAAVTVHQPHIIVVMTDDQRLDTLRYMPKTRALIGAAGTTFANAVASFPVCSPSRATFLTGQYAHNHGVLGNVYPMGGYHKLDHGNTLPIWLQDAGYKTAFVGKYLNHYGEDNPHEVPPGWDDWRGMLDYYYYGFALNENGAVLTFGGRDDEYKTDVFADRADEIIRLHAASNPTKPLFLLISTQAPHAGRNSKAIRDDAAFAHLNHPFGSRAMRHLGLFDGERFQKSRAYNEKDIEDKPGHIRTLDQLTAETTYGIEVHYRAKLEMLQAVDELIETVVGALTDTGLLEGSVVFFTSDNGYFHGEHRIVKGKHFPYGEALRIPLLVRGPGFPAGKTAHQLVANVDLAPTIVELAGADPGRVLDGRSLARLAQEPASGLRRAILLEANGSPPDEDDERTPERVDYRGVRDDRYQYIEYETGERELYYLVSDETQTNNRIEDPKLAGVVSRMQRLLRNQEGCQGDICSHGSP